MKDIYQVIKKVRISEKATMLQETTGELVFEVDRDANKIEIKNAIEEIFKVTVVNVNTVNVSARRSHPCVPPTMTASSSASAALMQVAPLIGKKLTSSLPTVKPLTSFKAPIRKESYHVPQVIQASYSL